MIDYATLCRAIEDWKAGHQPSAVTPAAPRRIAAPAHEEEAVEYSAMYDTSDAADVGDVDEVSDAPAAVPDSTVVYQLSEFEEENVETDDETEEVADDER